MTSLGKPRCPSGCGRARPAGKLMCLLCWREVPREVQQRVMRAWRAWSKNLDDDVARQEYSEARDAALGCIR